MLARFGPRVTYRPEDESRLPRNAQNGSYGWGGSHDLANELLPSV